MQGEMSQGRNVAQGEMSLREKSRREKSRREKCCREKCLSGRNVVQSIMKLLPSGLLLKIIRITVHRTMDNQKGKNFCVKTICLFHEFCDFFRENGALKLCETIFPKYDILKTCLRNL